jgi:hypothetical protein
MSRLATVAVLLTAALLAAWCHARVAVADGHQRSSVQSDTPWTWTKPGVMPWMCLERCGNTTAAQVMKHIDQIVANSDIISAVCFERFNLGPNGSLVINSNLTNVAPILRKHNFTTVAMVSSWPYPHDFLDWMRSVFADPEMFSIRLAAALVNEGIDGVNIDWEPTVDATAQDAADYAKFLASLRGILALFGKFVSVDVATWNPVWNFTQLSDAMTPSKASAAQGYVVSMNTYARPDWLFLEELTNVTRVVAADALVVGIETWPQLTSVNVSLRCKSMKEHGVTRVGVWDMPLPDIWWSLLRTELFQSHEIA